MSNQECTCYARIALLNLIEKNEKITPDSLFYEMCYLFDTYSESQIKEEAFFRLDFISFVFGSSLVTCFSINSI